MAYLMIKVHGRIHVMRAVAREAKYTDGTKIPDPNYRGTGMALCGVIDKDNSMDNWIKKYENPKN